MAQRKLNASVVGQSLPRTTQRVTGSLKSTIKTGNMFIVSGLQKSAAEVPNIMDIPDSIKKYVIDKAMMPKPRVRKGSLSPSGLVTGCNRAVVLNYLGLRDPGGIDFKLQTVFDDGTFRHLRIQMRGLHAGVFDDIEVEQKNRVYGTSVVFESHADAVGGSVSAPYFVEIKGSNSFQFTNYQANTDAVIQSYLAQCMGYFYADASLERCYIVVENKDSQEYEEVSIERTNYAPHLAVYESRVKDIATFIENRTLPDPLIGTPQHPQCQRCNFTQSCLALGSAFPTIRRRKVTP